MHETEPREVGGSLTKDLRGESHILASENDLLGFRDPFFEERRRDRALVDVEEGDVVVGDLVKEDDELHEVGVRLLPKRFLATPEKIIQKRGDVVCEGVGVQVVVKWVVAVFGIEADFDVILSQLVTYKDV